jgi:hypothetical protein
MDASEWIVALRLAAASSAEYGAPTDDGGERVTIGGVVF